MTKPARRPLSPATGARRGLLPRTPVITVHASGRAVTEQDLADFIHENLLRHAPDRLT